MMHKRTVYSLLLTSFILVFAFSSALAQSVTFESKNANRCESGVLNVTVDPGASDSLNAIEIVFEVSSASGGADFDNFNIAFDAGLASLNNRIIDVSQYPLVRIAALATDLGDICLSGVTVVAQVEYLVNDVCSGEISLDGAVYTNPDNALIVASTQFVDCAENSLISAAVIAGIITVVNETPTIDPISNATLSWTSSYSDVATADDPDLPNGCENLTFSKLAGPAGLSVNATTGVISWNPPSADIGVHAVTIQVADACGATATSSFEICVTNEAPVIASCSTPDRICWGEGLEGSVTASDPDGGPAALLYSLSSFSGPGTVTVNPSTGDWTWQTDEQNEYIGTFELCIVVTDGANTEDPCSPSNADTCCVEIEVIPTYRVSIEKTVNTGFGSLEDVSISLDNGIDPGNPMGGYDLLIQYDASVLLFNSADIGALIDADGWEYFQYRHGQSGDCGSNACPSGILRVVAIAETNNNLDHPSGFGETPAASSELAVLHFLVTNDYTLECQYVPIRFKWYDCGDNAISSQSGDTLFISDNVYDTDLIGNIADPSASFPTLQGANSSCDVAVDDGKPDLERCIDFWNGGIFIVCVEDLDDRGDINLNNLANEVADAVLFSNYFVYGIIVFTINPAGQIAATDVNADGTVLSVADLVYLIRIVIGDAQPIPKFTPTEVAVRYTHDINGVMSIKDDVQIGAAHLVISGEVAPILLASEMEIQYAFDGTNTRVLVWSVEGNSFTGDFLNVTGDIVSLEMATYEGHPVSLEVLPTEYALNQNYPNPFNPSTVISFSLPTQSDYTLTIFNVNGQKVAAFDGSAEAGEHEVVWEAGTVHASGIYFYRLVAENGSDRYVDTKKMVLLK